MKSTASFAAIAIWSARGSAFPMSSDARITSLLHDEKRILPAFKHSREIVKRRVRIAVAQTFDERRNHVVMFFARFVVRDRLAFERRFERGLHAFERHFSASSRARVERHAFERCERAPASPSEVAASHAIASSLSFKNRAESPSGYPKARSTNHAEALSGASRSKPNHPRARKKRGIQLKRGIFGRRADQRDRAVLDMRKKRVLLRLVESMNLVDEKNRSTIAHSPGLLRFFNGLFDVFHARKNRAQRFKIRLRLLRDDFRERRFAGPGGPQRIERGHRSVSIHWRSGLPGPRPFPGRRNRRAHGDASDGPEVRKPVQQIPNKSQIDLVTRNLPLLIVRLWQKLLI